MANIRFNLEFPEDYKNIVADLMGKTNLRTQKDLFENALALFGWAVKEVSRGRVIASLDEEAKTYGELHMPALMNVATAPDNKSARPTLEYTDGQGDDHRPHPQKHRGWSQSKKVGVEASWKDLLLSELGSVRNWVLGESAEIPVFWEDNRRQTMPVLTDAQWTKFEAAIAAV
jgi:hypothetical protein